MCFPLSTKRDSSYTSVYIGALSASSPILHLLVVLPGNPFFSEKRAKQRGNRLFRSPTSSAGLDCLRFSSIYPQHPLIEVSHDRHRYVERRALHYQTNTDKPQCEQAIGATGQALVRLSRSGRLNSCMALFEGQTAATRRKRVQEEWLRFCLHMGFSHWVFSYGFSLSPWP